MSRRRDKLVALRLERGWSQEDVAKQLRVTTSFYGMIEQGVRTPRLALALAMESLFGVPVSELFFEMQPNEVLGGSDETSATLETA